MQKPLEPLLQLETNTVWQSVTATGRGRPLEVGDAADIAAEDADRLEWARGQAAEAGFPADTFAAALEAAYTAPDVGTLYDLRRRGLISDDDFTHGLHKEKLEDRWRAPMRGLLRVLLSPAQLANAVVQGFRSIDDAAADAQLQGVQPDDFQTMVDVTGMPPGPETLQEWTRRGIITAEQLDQGIREGHTKTKYLPEYRASLQRVLGATEYAGLWLRGWITEAQAKAGGALTGYSAEDMQLLYLNRGRPATTRQVHIGYARGGKLPGASGEREAFDMAVRQSNVRTEYADLLWAQRYTYPSAFVIRALAQDGTFSRDQTQAILVESGWPPEYAALAADAFTTPKSGGTSQKWADRARTRVFTAAWSDFMDGNADEQALREMLDAIPVPAAEQDAIVALAKVERNLERRDLTQAQVVKLYKKGVYQRDRALAALEDLGMTADDATALLDAA